MPTYIAKRYASLLTKYDTKTLFTWLNETYGSISKAAEVAEIQRKTIYDWESSTEDIRLETKTKILEQNLKVNEKRTLEFLIRKTDNDLKEVLQHYIRNVFEKVMNTNSTKQFLEYAMIFREIQTKHRGAIFDGIPDDLIKLNQAVFNKAKDLGIELAKLPIHLTPPEILTEKVVTFLKVLETGKLTIDEMKNSFDLNPEFIDDCCNALHYLNPETPPVDYLYEKHKSSLPEGRGKIDWGPILPVNHSIDFNPLNSKRLLKEEL